MIGFYLLSLVPMIIGAVLFCVSKRVNWQEWLGGSVIALLVSAIMHGVAFYGMTSDVECWSGQITHVCHFPRWVEEYQQMHSETYTTGSGKNQQTHTRVWYTTEHATHHEHWVAYRNFGTISDEVEIDLQSFNQIKANFGNIVQNGGRQGCSHGGHYDGGDNNIYTTPNATGYIYPTTITRNFENRIKAAPTVFSFIKVPTNVPVYEYPKNSNWLQSDRLINEPRISILEFDRMNSRLGPVKEVNVIFINFGDQGSEIAKMQEASWLRGKKNDIVVCYGQLNSNNICSWSAVFGWSDSEICKRNLETILLEHPIDNAILPLIEQEIKAGYIIKDWSKFDYISITPPTWAWVTLVIVMLLSQVGFWVWANINEFDKINS